MRHSLAPALAALPVAAGALLMLALPQSWMHTRARASAPVPSVTNAAPPSAAAGPGGLAPASTIDADEQYFAQLRRRIRWVPKRVGRDLLLTPDLPSRLLLAKAAARRWRLHEVGLGYEDVYGIFNAETHWVPRRGASRDGTPNLGIAQFEPATAAALGVRDPDDVAEAVDAVAQHMREAAQWSSSRISGLRLDRRQKAAKLREGVSVYYNLSSRGRAAWDGRNAGRLPVATSLHIRHAREGAQEAAWLGARYKDEPLPAFPPDGVLTAGAE
ncbi:MAG: hypothetical protein ACXWC6_01575 [Ramlibacter sp.]